MPKLIKDIVKKAIKKDTINIAKALTSPKAKIVQDLMAKKKGMGLKVDSTKKVTPIGGSKPSVIIKKEKIVKPVNPSIKNMPYKPIKKEITKKISQFEARKDMVPANKISGELKKRIDNFNKSKKVIK